MTELVSADDDDEVTLDADSDVLDEIRAAASIARQLREESSAGTTAPADDETVGATSDVLEEIRAARNLATPTVGGTESVTIDSSRVETVDSHRTRDESERTAGSPTISISLPATSLAEPSVAGEAPTAPPVPSIPSIPIINAAVEQRPEPPPIAAPLGSAVPSLGQSPTEFSIAPLPDLPELLSTEPPVLDLPTLPPPSPAEAEPSPQPDPPEPAPQEHPVQEVSTTRSLAVEELPPLHQPLAASPAPVEPPPPELETAPRWQPSGALQGRQEILSPAELAKLRGSRSDHRWIAIAAVVVIALVLFALISSTRKSEVDPNDESGSTVASSTLGDGVYS